MTQRTRKSAERKLRYWFRMPNWLGDVMMALPLIRALKEQQGGEVTLVTQKHFIPLLKKLNIADEIIPLPEKGWGYYCKLLKFRKNRPDKYFLFTNSERADFESYVIGAPQRFGIQRPSALKRFFLTDRWDKPVNLDENKIHQTALWEQFFDHFGLKEGISYSPFLVPSNHASDKKVIGIIAGTENEPLKRWPIDHWRKLISMVIKKHKDFEIYLFGTAKDREITNKVAEGFNPEIVKNLAGTTDLLQFSQKLLECKTIVCNDTGGMHLANALGVPVVAVFGPTNPIRTGPIYRAPKVILSPKGYSDGDRNISNVTPDDVYQAFENIEKTDF